MKKKKTEKPESDELKKLQQQLSDLHKEKDEVFEKLQRVSADYANYQKRVPKQISDTIAYEKEMVIKSLLPALDNFEHTLQNANSAEDVSVFVKGVRIIYDQMLDILKSHGVEQIKALGETFDPSMHEAMMQKAEPDKEDNIVLEEFHRGYKLNGRIIRPSRVIVNKLISEQDAQQGQKQEAADTQEQATNEADIREEMDE